MFPTLLAKPFPQESAKHGCFFPYSSLSLRNRSLHDESVQTPVPHKEDTCFQKILLFRTYLFAKSKLVLLFQLKKALPVDHILTDWEILEHIYFLYLSVHHQQCHQSKYSQDCVLLLPVPA